MGKFLLIPGSLMRKTVKNILYLKPLQQRILAHKSYLILYWQCILSLHS
jgi:hypothetical protein